MSGWAVRGGIALGLDLVVYLLLRAGGEQPITAQTLSGLTGLAAMYLVGVRGWRRRRPRWALRVHGEGLAAGLMAMFLRTVVFAAADGSGPGAWALGAAAGAGTLAWAALTWPRPEEIGGDEARGRRRFTWLALGMIGYAMVLRLGAAIAIDLIPEEAYYWSYANRPALGYLDHPPMVSWLIGGFAWLLGRDEWVVRLPALGCWAIAAGFVFALTRRIFGRRAGLAAVVLMAVLPIYFSVGLLMTPDAPLYAAWAGALYALYRALVGGDRRWWLGVGIAVGLGMLSKYTIALLGPATLLFMLLDPDARRQLRTPWPWLSVGVALVVFSPVIYWNATHGWASFLFQGPGRWEDGGFEFSVHELAGMAVVLLTPIGLWGAIAALGRRAWGGDGQADKEAGGGGCAKRDWWFALVYTLTPLSVFVAFSVQGEPRLNWTGPVWLAVLPAIAAELARAASGTRAGRPPSLGKLPGAVARIWRGRLWGPVLVLTLLVYGGGFFYMLGGLPGADAPGEMGLPLAWEELGGEVEAVENRVEAQTGQAPLLVGLNKYNISSEIAFYDQDEDGFDETTGRHLFGRSSLMWRYWHPTALAVGRDVIMVDFEADYIDDPHVLDHFDHVGPIVTVPIRKHGRIVERFHYRVGYGYHAGQADRSSGPPPASVTTPASPAVAPAPAPGPPRAPSVAGA